ncbi:MAG: glycosyltransferase family 4 protein, partial [Candidatus Levyibacteriota bacterium]
HHFPTGKASTKNAFVYWCKLFVYKILLQISTLRAKKILTVSEATKEEIVQHLHVQENKIIVSHNGVEEIFLKHAKTTSLFPFAYILYVGNAYPHKNINVLLQAFKDVIVEEKNIHLVLVGKKDYFYNNVLHTVKNMGIEKQVDFISDATDEKLVSLFRHAKALVLPSLMEGFGLSAVEAMATGCPVIASDIASIREVCGSSAFYFNPKSPTELTKILSGVLEKDKTFFDEKIKKAKEKAATFSWEKMAPDVLAVYESCTRLR